MSDLCPCSTGANYDDCCGKYISGKELPETAELLMRSRYSAFVKTELEYIKETRHPKSTGSYDDKAVKDWATNSKWYGFDLINVDAGQKDDEGGTVEFVARYSQNGQKQDHHEISLFQKHEGRWFFVDGDPVKKETFVREDKKIGRNDPCSCGSGKKFKKCCG